MTVMGVLKHFSDFYKSIERPGKSLFKYFSKLLECSTEPFACLT